MVIVYSGTKGLAAVTLAIAHSRGWLDYEERVCGYWPEFAQQGKERITDTKEYGPSRVPAVQPLIDLRILSSIVRPCSESYSLASVCVEAHALLC